MNKTIAANHAEQPLLGNAVLQDALAEIKAAAGAAHANGNTAPGRFCLTLTNPKLLISRGTTAFMGV